MTLYVTASLLLALGLIHPINMSFALPKDLEGSGYDLDSSGSGSGDWPEQGRTFDVTHWPAKDTESYVIMANSKSFLENKQIFAGVIAGGITGVILATMLAGILIYHWHNKDHGGYSQGQQTHREETI
ncbi:syndecan-1-like [Toxotes jaculatrix]|uniref:syndecan-1-like n=1 Tax=Toxotes jaculatrix TaxID=941984 RepID=UPI001B3B0838|nr:syndecan-1-like [Toxotes jaculatrix]